MPIERKFNKLQYMNILDTIVHSKDNGGLYYHGKMYMQLLGSVRSRFYNSMYLVILFHFKRVYTE